MRQVALIEDKLTKQTFAVLVLSSQESIAFGALGQGEVWANWANSEKMTIEAMRASLDLTLTVGEMLDAGSIDIDSIEEKFSENTFAELKNEISKKALMRIIETKSALSDVPQDEPAENEFDIQDDYSVEENILNWPITDIGLASIDVAYKQIAVNYKTKAFIHDSKNSSLTLQVKGVRAVWDTNMPGGGGWRCPDDTPFGGQYTNRLGTGCTFGMVRRIGRGLVAASVRDIMKPSNSSINIDKPILNRAGHSMIAGAEKRRVARNEKFGRRVARRVEKIDKRTAKEKLRAANPTARDIYGSLNPDMTRRDRARISAGTVMARVGNDIRTDAFNASQTRRAARRIPKGPGKSKESTFKLNKKIPQQFRQEGGVLPSKLSSNGSILFNDGHMVNFDKMVDPEDVLEDIKRLGINQSEATKLIPNFFDVYMTPQERLDIIETLKANNGIGSPTGTMDEYIQEYLNLNRGIKFLTRKETEDYLSPENSLYRVFRTPESGISDELRQNGGVIPINVADNGIFINEASGEVYDFQTMIDTQQNFGAGGTPGLNDNTKKSLTKMFDGPYPRYITPNERYAASFGASIWDQHKNVTFAELKPNGGLEKLDPRNPVDFARLERLSPGLAEAMLAVGTGRKGPGKRDIIANRMRRTAENLVSPDRRKNRRISKIDDSNSGRDVVDDGNFKGDIYLARQWSDLIAPNSMDPNVGRGRFGQDNQGSAVLRNILDVVLAHVGIPYLGNDDARRVAGQYSTPKDISGAGNIPNWDKQNSSKAKKLADILKTNATTGSDKTTKTYEVYRNYPGTLTGRDSAIKESFEVHGEPSNTVWPKMRWIRYTSYQPRNPVTRELIRLENELPKNGAYYDAFPLDFPETLSNSAWSITGHVDIFFDEEGNLLQVEHSGVNPYYGNKNTDSATLINVANVDPKRMTNGLTGAMATYTTGRGVGVVGGKVKNQKNNNKRKKRGSKPNTPGIVQRIVQSTGLFGPPPTDTERAIRQLQGRKPRPTDARRERAAKFMRRMASRIRQEPVNPKDEVNYASLSQNYPLDPRLSGQRVSPSMPLSARHIYNGDPRVDGLLQNIPRPPGALASWDNDESNFTGIFELNNLLTDPNRKPLLPDSFDDANQKELQDVIDEWSKSFNDPNGPALTQGSVSNFGLTIEQVDSNGNTIRYSTRKPNNPPIYIEDSNSNSAHFLDDEGHHIVSAVVITDANGIDEVKYIASDYVKNEIAKSQTPAQNAKPTFIQRVLGRFRRPANQQQQAVPSTRARVRSVTNSSTRSGLRFSKTTTGPELPDASTLIALDKAMLSVEMQNELDHREASFRKKLGKAVGDTNPLTEDELLDWISNLAKTDPRRAGIEETNLHNFLVLTDFESTKDHNLINDLKPSLRKRVMDNAKVTGTGVDPVKRRPYKPYGPNRGNTPPAPGGGTTSPVPVRPTPSAPPTPTPTAPPTPSAPTPTITPSVTPSAPIVTTVTPIPRAAGSGPTITPGVGNQALGIVFEPNSGLYVDTATGEFVEDLSNLPIDQHSIYTPKPLVLDGGAGVGTVFPHLPVDTNSTLLKGIPQLRVAPGVDPNTPSLDITARPKTAAAKNHYVGVISSFANAARKRFEEHYKGGSGGNKKISTEAMRPKSELSYIDTRGAQVTSGVNQPVFPLLKDLEAIIAVQLLQNAATSNEILDGDNWLSRSVPSNNSNVKLIGDGTSNAYLDTGGFNVERLGLDPNLPIGDFYLPDAVYRTQTTTAGMIVPINRALQLEHAANNPIPGSTQQEIDNLRQSANIAWLDAQRHLSAVHENAVDARDNALSAWRRELSTNKRRNKGLQDTYIFQGAIAEQAAHLLEKHIANNPSSLSAIENGIRTGMEDRAKRYNERLRRVAARAAQGLPRAEGLYDNQPTILNPWNSPTPPQALRTASEIVRIRDDHRAQTLFEYITHGAPAKISDEQIEMLDVLGEMYDFALANRNQPVVGPPGSRVAGIVYPDHGTAHMGTVWQYNGFNSFPVLASREEILDMLKEVDADGQPRYVAISRGIGGKNRDSPSMQRQMVNDALTGDRFIPGQGGRASGRGEYWAQNPSGWDTFHGKAGGTMVAIISQDSKLVNRKQFGRMFGAETDGNSGESYESLWALYNALGAPNAPGGVNTSHGPSSTYGIVENSLLLGPNTKTLNSKQIAELDAHIDRLTAKGTPWVPGQRPDAGWGAVTLEGMNRDGRIDTNMKAALFPSAAEAAAMSLEELQEIEETKDLWNAWLQQRMTHVSDLVKMLQDESAGLQGAVDNNKKILRAIRSTLFMRGENIATMMGYDGFAAEGVREASITPSQIWKHALTGSIKRLVMLNRSSMIQEHKSITNFTNYKPLLEAIQYPNGRTAILQPGNWG